MARKTHLFNNITCKSLCGRSLKWKRMTSFLSHTTCKRCKDIARNRSKIVNSRYAKLHNRRIALVRLADGGYEIITKTLIIKHGKRTPNVNSFLLTAESMEKLCQMHLLLNMDKESEQWLEKQCDLHPNAQLQILTKMRITHQDEGDQC